LLNYSFIYDLLLVILFKLKGFYPLYLKGLGYSNSVD